MQIDNDLIERRPISIEAESLIRSNWAITTAYGIAGQNPEWHNYVEDLAQEAKLVMWHAAEKYDADFGGSIVGYCKQRGRWAILAIVSGQQVFTGGQRAMPVAQKRGDESRARLKATELYLRHELSREPTVGEVAAALGISERTVYKQRKSTNELPGEANPPPQVSLEELLTAAGNEAVLGQADNTASLVLAYHYKEIHEALVDLPNGWRTYVWLRFWEGWTEPELRREGLEVSWSMIRPILAEKLTHLIGVI